MLRVLQPELGHHLPYSLRTQTSAKRQGIPCPQLLMSRTLQKTSYTTRHCKLRLKRVTQAHLCSMSVLFSKTLSTNSLRAQAVPSERCCDRKIHYSWQRHLLLLRSELPINGMRPVRNLFQPM